MLVVGRKSDATSFTNHTNQDLSANKIVRPMWCLMVRYGQWTSVATLTSPAPRQYSDYEPYIQQICQGDSSVLSPGPAPRLLAMTSATAGHPKFLPDVLDLGQTFHRRCHAERSEGFLGKSACFIIFTDAWVDTGSHLAMFKHVQTIL